MLDEMIEAIVAVIRAGAGPGVTHNDIARGILAIQIPGISPEPYTLEDALGYATYCEQQWEDAKDRAVGLKHQRDRLLAALRKIEGIDPDDAHEAAEAMWNVAIEALKEEPLP